LVRRTFRDVLGSPATIICIDIPIGLLDRPGQRACDVEARRMLGRGLASSVFPPPSRRALSWADYRAASDVNLQLTGRRLNKQSFNISPKVREVDELMKPGKQERVREAHPELSFASLNGGLAVTANKKTKAGREQRWRLLRAVLSGLPRDATLSANLRGRCQPDDYRGRARLRLDGGLCGAKHGSAHPAGAGVRRARTTDGNVVAGIVVSCGRPRVRVRRGRGGRFR